MKTLLILISLFAFVVATPINEDDEKSEFDKFFEKHLKIYRLYKFINQPSFENDIIQKADEFKFEDHWDQWTKPEFAKQFWYYYQHDILPKGEIFSIFYPQHLKQAVALFKTFHYAKDYKTFYNIAAWARQNVNEGMYVYALSVAIIHSKWIDDVVLPPIYEIFPNYFFSDEVIHKARQYKQQYWGNSKLEETKLILEEESKVYTIHANYSGWYMNVHPEQSISYYTEDIGLNSNNYYEHIFIPFWMDNEITNFDTVQRGEYFFWYHQQKLARYYLERLSNGMGEIPHFSYEDPIETGYYPSLTYNNGLQFPTRPNHANLYYHGALGKERYGNYTHSYTYVKDYERRLRDALDMGHFYTPEGKIVKLFEKDGLGILGNLVESNADSLNGRFYGDLLIFARHLLGYSYYPLDQYKLAPSALEHYETAMRDPMFWQLFKRITYYYYQHQNYQGPYSKEDLDFNGVKIEDVNVDTLQTYFEYFYSGLSNILVVNKTEYFDEDFEVRARQYRLNHKEFNYTISVMSQKSTEALVKIFIGPKYDEFGREIKIEENRKNFFEIDRFQFNLNAGKNLIKRNSKDSEYFAVDSIELEILKSLENKEDITPCSGLKCYGFPHRLMLPKGDVGGKTYQFYVMIAPYHAPTKEDLYTHYFVDNEYSMGYPLDRPIEFEDDFLVSNFYFKDVKIYHKNIEKDISTVWSNH